MHWSIRTRLTVWNAVVNASIIIGLGVIVYFAMAKTLLGRVDSVLTFEYRETVERLEKMGADEELGGIPEAFLDEFLLRVTDLAGRVRMESPSLHGIVWQPPVSESRGYEPELVTTVMDTLGEHRMIFGQATGSHAGWTVQIASSLAEYRREMAKLRGILMLLLPASLLITSIAAYGLAGRALAPVERITQAAQQISGSNLEQRIHADRPDDELGFLAGTLNAMVDRLAESLEATRRFTADASHELLTPLAQIRTEVEVTLQNERSAEEYSQVLHSVTEEVERLTRLSRQLLALAKEDSQMVEPQYEDCPLDSIVGAAVVALEPVASAAGVMLSLGKIEAVTESIDPDHLRQALDNLILNAIQYNQPGGRVTISMQVGNREVVIAVEDSGIGIPNQSLPLIFERFYRVDRARSRRTGGTGLGLSISRTLIENMNGRVEVDSTLGQGSTFRIVLPTRLH